MDGEEFVEFVREVEPRLRRALVGARGVDGAHDAVAEALGWAWEHRDRLDEMDNPAGYLYRVAQSRSRPRRRPTQLPQPREIGIPDVEPGLVAALRALPMTQRTAVWLVHGCGFTYGETAEAMGIGASTVGTHLGRAMEHLRRELGARIDG